MSNEKKLAMLEEVLEMDKGELSADMVLADIDEYTSMTKLGLIVMMNDEFDKNLTSDQIKAFHTVQDIMDFME